MSATTEFGRNWLLSALSARSGVGGKFKSHCVILFRRPPPLPPSLPPAGDGVAAAHLQPAGGAVS